MVCNFRYGYVLFSLTADLLNLPNQKPNLSPYFFVKTHDPGTDSSPEINMGISEYSGNRRCPGYQVYKMKEKTD